MKKALFTMAFLLTLSMGLQAAGQKHRHTPRTAQADSVADSGIDAFSDTTSTDTAATARHRSTVTVTTPTAPWSTSSATYTFEDEDFGSFMRHLFSSLDRKDLAGMFFVLCVLVILFVLAPVLIIVALFYFINKNRKEKMRLAQMAMQQGQPIPDQLLNDRPADVQDEYQKGMRQCFVGVGLMIFLGYAAGNVGFGIGALVFCIGLGKVFVSKTAGGRGNGHLFRDDNNNNNNNI